MQSESLIYRASMFLIPPLLLYRPLDSPCIPPVYIRLVSLAPIFFVVSMISSRLPIKIIIISLIIMKQNLQCARDMKCIIVFKFTGKHITLD